MGGNRGVVLWKHFVRGLSGDFKEDSVEITLSKENKCGLNYKKWKVLLIVKTVGENQGPVYENILFVTCRLDLSKM